MRSDIGLVQGPAPQREQGHEVDPHFDDGGSNAAYMLGLVLAYVAALGLVGAAWLVHWLCTGRLR